MGRFYSFLNTTESQVIMDSAGMWFIGNEEQNCEAGGEDLGANGASAGNFGAGQMVVGQDSQATYVHLKDSINNGNRTGGKPEALYLYGLNGENGLRILGGSTLFLDDLHAYAKIDGNMVHLNSLVPPGAPQVEFDEGYLRVTMPDPNDMLHVHFHTPRGPVYEPVDHVEIRFNRPVNPDTFDPNDIIITGPNGPLDPNDIKGVIPVDPEGYAWQIEFTEQYINGDYSLTIGPHIEDLDGQEMDESGNGNPGESGDAYPAEFTIYIGVDVHILSPEDGSVYDIGDSIPFKASGLTGSPPIDDTWSSNIDGEFSNRQEENVSTLSIGEHIITLLGTDQVNDTDEEQIALALLADNIIEAGGSIHRIQVTYTDNFAIDASSLNFGDIWITGPHDYGKPAKYISKDALGDGSPRSATYGVLSPGEEWDMTDNGIYYVQLRSETVKDINGNYADGRFLGTFEVAIAENCYQVASLNQLDKRRVGRSEYEYRFNVILRTSHCAEEKLNVRFKFTDWPEHAAMVYQNVYFPYIGPDQTMTSEGQLILRIDREYPTDIAELKWEMIPYIPADFTHDGSVNVADLHIFASHWLMRDCENFMYRCEELDRDSYINLDDFSIFARYWPQGVN